MKSYLVNGVATPIFANDGHPDDNGPGFRTPPTPTVKPGKSYELAVPDSLKPRLKIDKDTGDANAAEEDRFQKQRQLIQSYKQENPGTSLNKMWADLQMENPDLFTDPTGEDDDDEFHNSSSPAKAANAEARAASAQVISSIKAANPTWSTDEVYAYASRNRLIAD